MGVFKYEDDLLKHHVRTTAWLPVVRRRLAHVRRITPSRTRQRRLRYFTFCAVGAVDVLMLDVAKVLRPSQNGFDTVVFFDKREEWVLQTQRNIPGSQGFVGKFVDLVLMTDPEGDLGAELGAATALSAPADRPDTVRTRQEQRDLNERRRFVGAFPFDVINLDIEEFAFKPSDPMPGKVVNAVRKLCAWQRNPLVLPNGKKTSLDGFSFMFTSRIGPPNIGEEYLTMLSQCVQNNIDDDAELLRMLESRAGVAWRDATEFRMGQFDLFFALALPKVLSRIFLEEDWYVDPDAGVSLHAIERSAVDGPYTILHVVMDVRRQVPPRESRAPGQEAVGARDGYRAIVRELFAREIEAVTAAIVDAGKLSASLELIRARRRKYNPDQPTIVPDGENLLG